MNRTQTSLCGLAVLCWVVPLESAQGEKYETARAAAALAVQEGRIADAEKKLLGILREAQLNSETDPQFHRALDEAAGFYSTQKRHHEAETHYEWAVGVRLSDMARALAAQGKGFEAEKLLERSLEHREHALGKDHLTVAVCLEDLAAVETALGKWDRAATLLSRVVEIRTLRLGANHPITVACKRKLDHVKGAVAILKRPNGDQVDRLSEQGHDKIKERLVNREAEEIWRKTHNLD